MGQAILAPSVLAYPAQTNVTLDVLPSESYDTLIRRAEAVARAAAQRSFDRDLLINQISVVILAQNQANTVPILTLSTTRSQWRSRPDARRWATYYPSAKPLLGFDNRQPTAATPAAAPATTSPDMMAPGAQSPLPNAAPGQTLPNGTPAQVAPPSLSAPPQTPTSFPGQSTPTPTPVQATPPSRSSPPTVPTGTTTSPGQAAPVQVAPPSPSSPPTVPATPTLAPSGGIPSTPGQPVPAQVAPPSLSSPPTISVPSTAQPQLQTPGQGVR
jgi:hypothetical protein